MTTLAVEIKRFTDIHLMILDKKIYKGPRHRGTKRVKALEPN